MFQQVCNKPMIMWVIGSVQDQSYSPSSQMNLQAAFDVSIIQVSGKVVADLWKASFN